MGSLFLLRWCTLKPKKEQNNFHFFPHKMTRQSLKLGKFMTDQVANTFGYLWLIKWQIRLAMSNDQALFRPLPPPPNDPKNQNFEEKKRKMSGDIILLYIHVYHKWRSYDIWFLKYKEQQTEIYIILDCFLPFNLPNNPKN